MRSPCATTAGSTTPAATRSGTTRGRTCSRTGSCRRAFVGYGWSILLLPIAPFAGPNLVSALPALVLFNTVILLPVALLSIYGIAARIAGRLFGYWAVAVDRDPLSRDRLPRARLPPEVHRADAAAGPRPDLGAGLSVSRRASRRSYFTLRALDSRRLAFAGRSRSRRRLLDRDQAVELDLPRGTGADAARASRSRALLPFAVALAPALLTLALWKYRGLGELAAAPAEPVRLAGGSTDLFRRIHNNDLNSWAHLDQVLAALQGALLGGTPDGVAAARRARRARDSLAPRAHARRIVVRDLHRRQRDVPSRLDRRRQLLAHPHACLPGLRAAHRVVVLTRPTAATLDRTVASCRSPARRLTAAFVVALAVFAAAPLGVIAATPQLHDNGHEGRPGRRLARPGLRRRRAEGDCVNANAVALSWQPQGSSRAKLFYRVLRAPKRPAERRVRRPLERLRRLPSLHGSGRLRLRARRSSTSRARARGRTGSASRRTG